MKDRDQMTINNLDAFRVWLSGHGYKSEAAKDGELLRVRKDGAPVIFYAKGSGITSIGDGLNLVKRFVRGGAR